MRSWLTVLPVLLLLLGGCTQAPARETTLPVETTLPEPTEPDPGLLDPDHPVTQQSKGAIAAYPLDGNAYSMYLMGERILLVQPSQEGIRLTVLSGDTCVCDATTMLENRDICRFWTREDRVAYYDPATNALVVMDGKLREVERILLPKEAYVSMELDSGFTTLYYSLEDKLCAVDLQTGISRLLRQSDGRTPEILSLEDGTLLQCRTEVQDTAQLELVACQNGFTYYTGWDLDGISVVGGYYYALHTDGPIREYIYGDEENTWVFRPVREESLLSANRLADGNILAVYDDGNAGQTLELYDMQEKTRSASVTVPGVRSIYAEQVNEAGIWFVAQDDGNGADTLCCWKPALSSVEPAECLFPHYTRENPDAEGLAECQAYAESLGDTYGITIMLTLPEELEAEYIWEEEYQVSAIEEALEELEQALAQFPKDFYQRVVRVTNSRSFTVSLVRSITAANGSALPDGNNLQVWVKGDAFLVVEVGENTREMFYHQLWHMTETYVLARNSVLDTWGWLNPEGFAYLESYVIEEQEIQTAYLQPQSRAFIDSLSMTYPREDRASVFAHAMMEGNAELFESETMQRKLQSMSVAIRKAFRWMEREEIFPWEQYLAEPLPEES